VKKKKAEGEKKRDTLTLPMRKVIFMLAKGGGVALVLPRIFYHNDSSEALLF